MWKYNFIPVESSISAHYACRVMTGMTTDHSALLNLKIHEAPLCSGIISKFCAINKNNRISLNIPYNKYIYSFVRKLNIYHLIIFILETIEQDK